MAMEIWCLLIANKPLADRSQRYLGLYQPGFAVCTCLCPPLELAIFAGGDTLSFTPPCNFVYISTLAAIDGALETVRLIFDKLKRAA